jgi:hypothetical protein
MVRRRKEKTRIIKYCTLRDQKERRKTTRYEAKRSQKGTGGNGIKKKSTDARDRS